MIIIIERSIIKNKNMDITEILKKNIKRDSMKAAWFPPDWHKIIAEKARKAGLPFYKYVMMIDHKQIIQNEKSGNKK